MTRTLFLTLIATAVLSAAPVDPVNKSWRGVALQGYDPVAYFTASKATKGSDSISHEWMGAKWYFSSDANRKLFIASPEKYAPQFGGYCAWAVSNNYTANADPEAWKIIDGKLYVNYNKDVQKKWEAEALKRIEAGNKNWPNLHK
ncbi:MAG: YHS domain-containing (seleno)protein [Bryobacteraceae bacterium]|nr:YHS domain-containing (seleno)protein [Bryobacteraceae bacterium]